MSMADNLQAAFNRDASAAGPIAEFNAQSKAARLAVRAASVPNQPAPKGRISRFFNR